MNAHLFQNITEKLLKLHSSKQYLTYDDIMDICDTCNAPLSATETILTEITDRGCKVFDHVPTEHELNSSDITEVSFESIDYAHIDYEALYREVLAIDPGLTAIIQYARQIRPAQHGEASYIFANLDTVSDGRHRLFDMSFRAVIKIAFQKYSLCDEELADLIQIGSLGLLISIDKYDVTGETPFAAYANSWIFQAISRAILYRKNGCYFPAHISDTVTQIEHMASIHACSKCSGTLLYCPNLIAEIQKHYKLDYDSTKIMLSYAQDVISCEELIENDPCTPQLSDLDMCCQRMDNKIFDEQRSNVIDETLNALRPIEREIIHKRFGLDGTECLTLDECGSIYGVTRERIRQIEHSALRKLKNSDSMFNLFFLNGQI